MWVEIWCKDTCFIMIKELFYLQILQKLKAEVKRICRRCAAVDVQRFQQISTSLETMLVRANFTQDSAHARLSSRTNVKYKRLVISCDDMELTHASLVSPLCIILHMHPHDPFISILCVWNPSNQFVPNDFDTCVHNKCFFHGASHAVHPHHPRGRGWMACGDGKHIIRQGPSEKCQVCFRNPVSGSDQITNGLAMNSLFTNGLAWCSNGFFLVKSSPGLPMDLSR